MNSNGTLPWVEKYRPSTFKDIVLEPLTKELLEKMLEKGRLPNLLLYGPPGTGKTTTAVNLVNEYRRMKNETSAGHVIHLNASDERGIDIVRGPISQFVNSSSLFLKGTKFVILDEADYMTATAQHALRQLLQSFPCVRFCLICNYVSKIDESLCNEFVRLRFNHLPDDLIESFLENINQSEKLGYSPEHINAIRLTYGSDMRSMINFLQINPASKASLQVVTSNEWNKIMGSVLKHKERKVLACLTSIAKESNGVKNTIRDFSNYIIENHTRLVTLDFLTKVEFIVHSKTNCRELEMLRYFVTECLPSLEEA
jgi:replication factor C subunit 3/5